jgi:dienelactone hydrolase
MALRLIAALALVGTLLVPAPASATTTPRYAQPGPYAAGVTTLDLPDRKVEVWYPATKKAARGAVPASFDLVEKAPPAIVSLLPPGASAAYETAAFRDIRAAKQQGGFPLVLMAHGTAGYREQLSYLGAHLASWGFVVASPDILERGLAALLGSPPATPVDDVTTMRATEALLRAENTRAGGPLRGRVMPDRVAVTGQSAGGSTAIRFASEPGVVTAIPLSASGYDARTGTFLAFPAVPMMFVTGAADQVVPVGNVQQGFETANPPVRSVVIGGAGHASVAGICPIGGSGGLVGLAERSALPVPDSLKRLASDGCSDPAPNPDPAWAPIDHAVTAQLRAAFGIDRRPKGLDQETFDAFAPVAVTYRERR